MAPSSSSYLAALVLGCASRVGDSFLAGVPPLRAQAHNSDLKSWANFPFRMEKAEKWTETIAMEPHDSSIDLRSTALIVIDMQRDFLEPGGFGSSLGNDVTTLQSAVEPCEIVLSAARNAGILIIHTREGHRPEMSDLHRHKNEKRGKDGEVIKRGPIGEKGPFGRVLIRGEPGQDIIPRLYPRNGEPIIDKPGKGSFYATDLEAILSAQGITTLIVCGVTTEVCVHTTVREANDRGFHCLVVSDACASYSSEFHRVALEMISAQGGIFGSVTDSAALVAALSR